MKVSPVERVFKFLASLQLAMIVMAALGILSATGTILEARYDATYAQKMVYQSPWMIATMILLCVNLLNVMIDRWPWKAHHSGFVLAHIGIITLILGSWVTHKFGVDGSLSFEIGRSNRFVMLSSQELVIAKPLGDGHFQPLYQEPVDFLLNPPQKYPLRVNIDGSVFEVVDYFNYAIREAKMGPSNDSEDGPAIRFQMQNERFNMTQWLRRPANAPAQELNLGPARVVMLTKEAAEAFKYSSGNIILVHPAASKEKLDYEIYTTSKNGLTKKGVISEGDTIETGWMGIQLRLLKYYEHSHEKTEFTVKEQPTGLTVSAVKVRFGGQEYTGALNEPVKIRSGDKVYIFSMRNRLLDIGFDMTLANFNVGRYQGSSRAMSYQSEVQVPGLGLTQIYMNHPLKYNGFTFYQASFQENEKGEPTTSILSVNKDPGRVLKYFGSFLIVLGTILMFYFKHYRIKIFSKLSKGEENHV